MVAIQSGEGGVEVVTLLTLKMEAMSGGACGGDGFMGGGTGFDDATAAKEPRRRCWW